MLTRRMFAGAGAATVASAGSARAQGLSSRPVRLILPVQAGSGVDGSARVMVDALSKALGQTVVIDNQPGAGGTMGTALIVRAPPDGQTIGLISTNHAVNPAIYPQMPFDSLADITPIILVSRVPLVVLAHPSLGISNVAELVALAKSKPGVLNYGSSGNGTILHIAMAWLATEMGIDMQHIPYRGAGQLIQDLLAGQIQLAVFTVSVAGAHVQSGKLRALGVTTAVRTPVLPEVPTVAEQGVKGYEVDGWFAAIGPKHLPVADVARLNGAFHTTLAVPEVRDTLEKQGNMLTPGTPEGAAAFLRSEVAKYGAVAKRAGIRLD